MNANTWNVLPRAKVAPAYSNFDVAAYLTEIMLLGCVALRTGKKLEWDGPKTRVKNAPEAPQTSGANIARVGSCKKRSIRQPGKPSGC